MPAFSSIVILIIWPIFWLMANMVQETYLKKQEMAGAYDNAYKQYAALFIALSVITLFLMLQVKRAWTQRESHFVQTCCFMGFLFIHLIIFYFVCWQYGSNNLGLWWKPLLPW